MKVIQFSLNDVPRFNKEFTLCIGYFDGVHNGHRYLIHESQNEGYKSAVLTFDRSPACFILNKEEECITPLKMKSEIFELMYVDYLFVMKFDDNLMNLTADEFIEKVLKALNPVSIYVGYDFTFGKNRKGNVDLLKKNFNVKVPNLITVDGEKCSSSKIRNLIKSGNINKVSEQLGREYSIKGVVVKGLQNGRKLGFPTANLNPDGNYVLPKEGSYFGYVDGYKHKAIISVSKHPTISELNKPIIEVHLLDFDGDLYGKEIEVIFSVFHRIIKKFDNMDKLKEQLIKDEELAKKCLH